MVAAAVILDPARPVAGLTDSKKLTALQREQLAAAIQERALSWAIAEATVAEIDEFNILRAALLAMQRAVVNLELAPNRLLVDGNHLPPNLACPASAVIRGDLTIPCISAASILAKTHRDALMVAWDARYPEYGFKDHKGYGTRRHREALLRFGACPLHRKSFAPVRRALQNRQDDF